jgi:hypothetical protein
VITDAMARPIITDFTTMSASMNMLHGDKSRGRLWACTMAGGEDVATGVGVVAGAVTSLATTGVAAGAVAGGSAGGAATAGGVEVDGVEGVVVAAADGVLGVVASGVSTVTDGGLVGAGCVLSCAAATAMPASIEAIAIPASLETFENVGRR